MKNSNLAVTHIYRTYFPDPPGGMQEAIRQIALATAQQGIVNTIFTLSEYPTPKIFHRAEGRVVREKSWAEPASCNLGSVAAFQTYSCLVKASDIVHYFYPWPFADILHAGVRPQCPAVMTYVSDVVRQRWLGLAYAPLMWRTLKKMKLIVANSPFYANTSPILSHPDIRRKVRIIPLGIEESSYDKVGDDRVLRRLDLEDGEPFFLFIGVLRYYKGAHFLVKAVQDLGAKLVVAGTGPESESLKILVAETKNNNVIFAGQVTDSEKVSLLQKCRALVLPSHLRSEAYGMVLVEAAMFSKPLVSCEIGTGTSFVNAHEETGFVVAPEAPDELRAALKTLLVDEALAIKMGVAARARYERLFSGQVLGQAYAALFREIAGV